MITDRDDIYKEILHYGIVQIRALAWQKNTVLCAIEADHLHNIPNYIGSKNSELHRYYLEAEVPSYLNQLSRENITLTGMLEAIYIPAWKSLREMEGIA